jgi:four helix bundle protein
MNGIKDLKVYQKAFHLAMKIFEVSKSFPKEEKYSLTDQIRRSSRSVCANLAEAYRKRQYPKYFYSKLTDSDAESSETSVWLDFALKCDYLNYKDYEKLSDLNKEIGKMLGSMIRNYRTFVINEE